MIKLKTLKFFLSKKRDFRYKNLRIIYGLKLYSNNIDM